MVKANVFLPSVNAGEFSTKLLSRIDFGKYPNGAALLKNYLLQPQGGFYRRPGFRHIVSTKSDGQVKLVPFVFDVTDSYIIEIGNLYMRFIRRQAQITVADTDAAITNGTFASNITGWTDRSTGSAGITHSSAEGGEMSLDGSAGDTAWAEQSVTTSNTGTEHVLRFKSRGVPGLKVKVQIGSATLGDQLFEETALGVGYGPNGAAWAYHTVAFTPDASPFYVQFKNDNNILDNGEDILIDDVSFLDNAPLEIETPWTTSDFTDLKFVQAGDVVYFEHPDYPTFKLERRGHTTWSLVQVYWKDGPWGEINPDTDLIDKQLCPNPDLLTGMTDWDNNGSAGDNSVTKYDGDQQIIALIPTTDTDDANAEIEVPVGFRQGTSTRYVAHFLTVGGREAALGHTQLRVGTTSGAVDLLAETPYEAGWHTISYTTASATNHFFRFRMRSSAAAGGVGGLFIYPEDAQLMHPSGTTGSITVNARGFTPFKSTDVGRYIRFEYPGREPGWGIITAFASSSAVTLQVRRKIPVALPTESWRLGSWSERTGFPRTMAFFEGRAVLANNADNTRGLWFSQSLDLENMRPDSFVEGGNTVEDDDALDFTLQSPSANDIQWLTALQQLVIGTMGGPWVAESSGSVLTPSDRTFRQQTKTKISDLAPLLISNAILFVDQSQKRLFDLGFQFETDAYVAADLTQLAEHVASAQIAEIAFQQDPNPVIWMRRVDNDGQLYALAYSRAEDIVGWSRMELGGSWGGGVHGLPAAESIVTIPGSNDATQTFDSGDRDEVWIVAKRTINSSTVRHIEVMERAYDAPLREGYATEQAWIDAVQADQRNAFYVDSGITFDVGAKTISGLTAADPAVVTATAHGYSDGNEVVITDVLGMVEVNGAKFFVADQVTNSFALTSTQSAKTITSATQANPVVITSVAHGFSDGDVVGIFDVGGMTEINGKTFTVANKTDDTFELTGEDGTGHTAYTTGGNIYHATNSSAFTAYVSGGKARATTTTVTGASHLEGETIDVLADGQIEKGLTVSGGGFTLATAAGFVHYGLPYTSEYESLKIHYGARAGTGVGKPKRLTGLTLALLDAGKFSVGTVEYNNQTGRFVNAVESVDFSRTGASFTDTTLSTWEHIINLPPGSWSSDPRIWITASDPLPLTVLGVGPNIDMHESQAAR